MKNLCVIFGGQSVEHDISIITGMQLVKCVEEKYKVNKVYYGLDGRFYLANKLKNVSDFKNKKELKLKPVFFYQGGLYYFSNIKRKICDVECVINCCHGGNGENGNLNALLEMEKIKCTSAQALSSHIAMDKSLAKKLVSNICQVVKGVEMTQDNILECADKIENEFKDELIVKPNSFGSSIGVACKTKSDYLEHVEAIFKMNDSALVEERIENMCEYNQAVMRTGAGFVLSAIERPITQDEILTFENKYDNQNKSKGGDREIPAKISTELENEISSTSKKICEELKINGVVRIDYIFDKTNQTLYFNEINTIPGSMAYYLFEPLGIDYLSLVEKLVENAPDIKTYPYFDTEILSKKQI